MATKRAFSTIGDVAIQILRLTAASADVFPPLKSAAGGALHIAEIVTKFNSNKTQWREFGTYVQDATASVVELLAQSDTTLETTNQKLERLHATLVEIVNDIESEQALPLHKRFGKFLRDPEMISSMRKRIDDVMGLFQFSATITSMIDVKKVLEAVEASGKRLSNISQHVALDRLRRVPGASWDSSRVCLENTRVKLIDDICLWINSPSEESSSNQSAGASIMLLTGVAGAGKTTIAHTIARRCAEHKRLGSSFFFDRETEGRNSPVALFTTFASDLSRLDARIACRIATAIEDDRSLPLAPISTQFDELVLRPCQGISFTGPIAIVIDALDEAWDITLLDILQNRAGGLPKAFRIFITSRMRPELDRLRRKAHVENIELDIGAQANTDDMVESTRYKLRQLAEDRDLGNNWPGEDLSLQFTTKAGGLFLWVATVCDYLDQRDDPTEELRRLVSEAHGASGNAEVRMDKLYAAILESFDWTDDSFVASYSRVMGIAIASKTPLTISAMRELYQDQPLASDYTLQKLSPLLTGMSKAEHENQPVRVLHQSLRDFLVVRSRSCPEHSPFALNEKEKSGELAVLCLNILNGGLNQIIPATGYLSVDKHGQGVPRLSAGAISEGLGYAARFWPDHLCDVEVTAVAQEALLELMKNNLVTWLEVTASYDRCRDLDEVRSWIKERIDRESMSQLHEYHEKYATACGRLSGLLKFDDRQEESLAITAESVALYRQLAADRPEVHIPRLAEQLVNSSNCLFNLGRYEEGLSAAEEAVDIYRNLVANKQISYIPKLAESLRALSSCLTRVGQYENGLAAITEAVDIYRKISLDSSAENTPDLAQSLRDISTYLSSVGRYEAALLAIQEAVDMYRKLFKDEPYAYACDLARSLHELSNCLATMERYEDALPIIQEAVYMNRNLAAVRPAVYTPTLAKTLHELCNRLSELGRYEEGLPVIQEAVELRRKLVAHRPTAHTGSLANSPNSLSVSLYEIGRFEDAMPIIHEAIGIQRKLAQDRPGVYLPNLAMFLVNHSLNLSRLEREEAALQPAQESVEIYRHLAATRPTLFQKSLKNSLDILCNILRASDRNLEALSVMNEADTL